MNYTKLNELAAQAMGWTAGKMMSREEYSREEVDVWKAPIGEGYRYFSKWNPCEDLNDASALLEKVAGEKIIEITRTGDEEFGHWEACIQIFDEAEFLAMKNEFHSFGTTEALAKTLCALRAAGIPESSITEATL